MALDSMENWLYSGEEDGVTMAGELGTLEAASTPAGAPAAGAPAAGAPAAGAPAAGAPAPAALDPSQFISKTEHQNELNRLLAEDRRKTTREAGQLRDTHAAMQNQLEELLQGKSIEEIREEIEATQSKLRSAEDNAKLEAQRFHNKLSDAETRATTSEQTLTDYLIDRSLKDAAMAEDKASSPASADLIAKILRDNAGIDPDTKSTYVEMEVEEDGVKAKKKLTPEEAIAVLESQPTQYGPLFKSFVAGGAGSKLDGIKRKGGGLDIGSMSMEQYAKLRQENGAASLLNNL